MNNEMLNADTISLLQLLTRLKIVSVTQHKMSLAAMMVSGKSLHIGSDWIRLPITGTAQTWLQIIPYRDRLK